MCTFHSSVFWNQQVCRLLNVDDFTKYKSIQNQCFLALLKGEKRKRNTAPNVEFRNFEEQPMSKSPLINNDKCDKRSFGKE